MDRNKTIKDNMPFVAYMIRKYFLNMTKGANDYEDLFQVGCMALIKAVDTYNQKSDIKFSTYASNCIYNNIIRFLQKDVWTKEKYIDRNYSSRVLSKLGDDCEIDAFNCIPSNYFSYDNIEKNMEAQDYLIRVTKNLTTKERHILYERVINEKGLKEIGKEYNVSCEAIRQNLLTIKEKCKKEALCLD